MLEKKVEKSSLSPRLESVKNCDGLENKLCYEILIFRNRNFTIFQLWFKIIQKYLRNEKVYLMKNQTLRQGTRQEFRKSAKR